jgi:hypothetical protein
MPHSRTLRREPHILAPCQRTCHRSSNSTFPTESIRPNARCSSCSPTLDTFPPLHIYCEGPGRSDLGCWKELYHTAPRTTINLPYGPIMGCTHWFPGVPASSPIYHALLARRWRCRCRPWERRSCRTFRTMADTKSTFQSIYLDVSTEAVLTKQFFDQVRSLHDHVFRTGRAAPHITPVTLSGGSALFFVTLVRSSPCEGH